MRDEVDFRLKRTYLVVNSQGEVLRVCETRADARQWISDVAVNRTYKIVTKDVPKGKPPRKTAWEIIGGADYL